jgi:hypothetical protein
MWTVLVIGLVVVGLTAFVWRRQTRHSAVPGRFTDAESHLQQRGSYWGQSGMGGGA